MNNEAEMFRDVGFMFLCPYVGCTEEIRPYKNEIWSFEDAGVQLVNHMVFECEARPMLNPAIVPIDRR